MATATNAFPGWESSLLAKLKAPVSSTNVAFLDQWHNFEGSNAKNNPLNTTQPGKGATLFNSAGVKNYPTPAAGLTATYATLTNGYYPDVVSGLRSGNPYAYNLTSHQVTDSLGTETVKAGSIATEVSTWGSTNFAKLLGNSDLGTAGVNAITPPPGGFNASNLPPGFTPYTGSGMTSGHSAAANALAGAALAVPGVSQVFQAGEATGTVVNSVGDAFKWLFSNNHILRGGQIFAGLILVVVGFVILAKGLSAGQAVNVVTSRAGA